MKFHCIHPKVECTLQIVMLATDSKSHFEWQMFDLELRQEVVQVTAKPLVLDCTSLNQLADS